jgi:hypothetical protein
MYSKYFVFIGLISSQRLVRDHAKEGLDGCGEAAADVL